MATNTDFRVKNGLYVGESINARRGSVSACTFHGNLFDISTSGALGTGSSNSVSGSNTLNFEAVSGVNIAVSDNNLQFSLSLSNSFEIDSNNIDLSDTGVSVGTYGSQTTMPTFIVDAQGRLTAASELTVVTILSTGADTGIGTVDLLSESLSVIGTSNEITTVASNNTVTVGLPNDVTIGNDLTVTGDFSVNTLLTVISGGNVGIGTVNPNEKLTVSGNISASGIIYADAFESKTGGSTIDFNDNVDLDGTLTVSSTISGNNDLFIDGSTTIRGAVTLGNASGDIININGQTINVPNIVPGIDNTVVIYNGSSLVTDEIDSRVWETSLIDNNNSSGTANRITKWVDGNTIADSQIIEVSDNVGIGTSSPNEKLTVSGNISATGTVYADAFESKTGGSAISFNDDITLDGDITSTTGNFTTSLSAASLSGDGRALTTNSTISLAGDLGGSVALNNLDGTKTLTATIQANSVALGTDTTGNYVATIADAGSSRITVANSGSETAAVTLDITDNAVALGTKTTGNYVQSIALNTTHPSLTGSSLAAAEGNTITGLGLSATGVTANSYGGSTAIPVITVLEDGRLSSVSTSSISTGLTIAADSGSNDTVTIGTDTLTFAGTSNEVDTTVSNNQIQIGLPSAVSVTTSLSSPSLSGTNVCGSTSVSSPLVLGGDGAVSAPSYSFTGDTDTGMWRSGSDQLRIATGGTDRFCLTSSLATFTNSVCVNDNITVAGNLIVHGDYTTLNTTVTATSAFRVDNAGTGPALVANQTGSQPVVDFQDDGTSVFYIEDGGNVGIGTINPTVDLEVYNASGTDTKIRIDSNATGNAILEIDRQTSGASALVRFQDASSTTWDIGNYENTHFDFRENGSTIRMRIEDGGNVGIGTSSPNAKLTVSGNISATGTVYADAFESKTGGSAISFNDDITLDGDITGTTGNFTTSLSAAALSGDGRALTTNSTISLAGDLGGSVALNNLDGTKTLTATIQANSVALGTDTTGNYVATIADAGSSRITVANSGSETAAVTLDIADNAVALGTKTTGNYVQSLALNTTTPSLTGSSLAAAEGNTITGLGLSATGVTANSYGSTTVIPVITVLEDGRISNISTSSIPTDLTIAGDSGSNDTVTIGTDTLTFAGTSNEVDTTVSNNQIQIGLPSAVSVTTSISSPLLSGTNVCAATSVTTPLVLGGDGSVSAPSYSFTGDTDTGMWRSGSNQLNFTLGGTDVFCLTSSLATFPIAVCMSSTLYTSGKVGICNSNPNHALSVTGNISATGDAFIDGDLTVAGEVTYTASTVTATTTAFQDNFLLESTDSGSSGAPDITLYRNSSSPANDDDLGNILFRGRNDDTQDVEYAQILTDIVDVAEGGEDAKIRFLTMTAGTLTDTLAMDRGKVGIGTTDPSANLHIYGAGEQSLFVGSSNASRAIIELDGAANGDGAGGDYAYLAHEADGSFNIKNLQNNSMNFSTGSSGSTRMTITSAGKVGIGTTAPAAILDVTGTAVANMFQLSKSGVGIGAYMELTNQGGDASSNDLTITAAHSTNSIVLRAAQTVQLYTYASSAYQERFRIANDGKVGIGTVAPGYNLHVSCLSGAAAIGITGTGGSKDTWSINSSDTGGKAILEFTDVDTSSTILTLHQDNCVLPGSDNAVSLGSSSKRWANVYANCTTTGAVIESNLCTNGLDSCPEGSVVIWRDGKLQGTTDAYSHRVMGVTAPGSESPIVMGAENILVTGDIEEGDPIVTSDKYNHGMRGARSEGLHGKVIAEALERGSGESYIIRGMIRKF